jgi:hypothetical protein
MAGGSLGRIASFNGRSGGTPGAATTTPARVRIMSPFRRLVATVTRQSFARELSLRHLSGAGDLRVYLNGESTYITIKASESWSHTGIINSFVVASSTGTVEWEGTASVA